MKRVKFGELKPSDGFAFKYEGKVIYLMKTFLAPGVDAVDLRNGDLWQISDDDEVVKIDIEMSFEVEDEDEA